MNAILTMFYGFLDRLEWILDWGDPLMIIIVIFGSTATWFAIKKGKKRKREASRRLRDSSSIERMGMKEVRGRHAELESICLKADVSSSSWKKSWKNSGYDITRVYSLQTPEADFVIFDAAYSFDPELKIDVDPDGIDTRDVTSDIQTILLIENPAARTSPGTAGKSPSNSERVSAGIPDFSLYPEGMADKLLDSFTGMDIDFKDSPKFSDMFRLSGPEYLRESIKKFFSLGLRKFFEGNPGLCLAAIGGKMLIFRRDVLADEAGTRDLLDKGRQILRFLR